MTTTPNMSLVLPVEGGSSNVWDVILDVAFGLIDSHDHSTGQGVQVPTAGLNINGDLSFAGFSLTHLKRIALDEQSGTPGNKSIWTSSADHDLYWTNSSGVDVKITDGSTLNVSIVGGIGGDYSSVGALLSYDDATRRYLLQQEGSPRPWAGLATADIDLYEKAPSISNKITIKSPSALAASYTLTLPDSIPVGGSARLALFSTVTPGLMTLSNTMLDILTGPDFKHSNSIGYSIPASAAMPPSAGGSVALGASGGVKAVTLGTTNYYTFGVRIPVNAVITGFSFHVFKHSSNATTLTAKLVTLDMTTGTETVQSTITNADNGTGAATVSSGALTVNKTFDTTCYVAVNGGADALDLCYEVQVNWKRG